jgi:uncharacterized protein
VVAVVDQVRAMPEHAHARIAVWGFSFSTFPVLDTLARLDGAVHAVICNSGPTRDLSVIVSSLPRSGLLPVPRVLKTAPSRTLWRQCTGGWPWPSLTRQPTGRQRPSRA